MTLINLFFAPPLKVVVLFVTLKVFSKLSDMYVNSRFLLLKKDQKNNLQDKYQNTKMKSQHLKRIKNLHLTCKQ